MTQQLINVGLTANDGTGDPLRTGAQKINDNFLELYQKIAASQSYTFKNIQIGSSTISASDFSDTLKLTAGDNVVLTPNTSSKNVTISTSSIITADIVGNITGNVTGNVLGNLVGGVIGNITGNSGTATALQTTRTINGTPFNGTQNITVPGASLFTLGANGAISWIFFQDDRYFPASEQNPVLYLRRGETYTFVNNALGSNGFAIRVSSGGAAYNTGVSNNGATSGSIVFTVPMSAPSTLYYQSTVNSGMGNTINIV